MTQGTEMTVAGAVERLLGCGGTKKSEVVAMLLNSEFTKSFDSDDGSLTFSFDDDSTTTINQPFHEKS
jgi:hypothetical protein